MNITLGINYMGKISVEKNQDELSKLVERVISNQERIILQQDGQEVVILPMKEVGFWDKLVSMFAEIVEDKLDMQDAQEAIERIEKEGGIALEDLEKSIGIER